jgi:hypothetical protein
MTLPLSAPALPVHGRKTGPTFVAPGQVNTDETTRWSNISEPTILLDP